MPIVQVFLAEPGAGAFERKFKPESLFTFAGRFDVTPVETADRREELMAIAELAFAIGNSYPEEMHCSTDYLDQVRAYRAGRNRSISVGDVITIGEGFYFCGSASWDPIAEPSANLIVAFMSANESMLKEC